MTDTRRRRFIFKSIGKEPRRIYVEFNFHHGRGKYSAEFYLDAPTQVGSISNIMFGDSPRETAKKLRLELAKVLDPNVKKVVERIEPEFGWAMKIKEAKIKMLKSKVESGQMTISDAIYDLKGEI